MKCEARKKEDQKKRWKWWEWWRWIYRQHDEEFKFKIANEWTSKLHDVWLEKWESFRGWFRAWRKWLFWLAS